MKTDKVRYLLGGDMTAEGLTRLFGRVDLDQYYAVHKAFDKMINEAIGKPIRITDCAGTDVEFKLGKRGFEKPRRADKPGSYLVPGSCTMFPEVESVQGRIRVGSVFHEYYTTLAEPMLLEIDGKIKALHGGGNERFVADRALRRAAGGTTLMQFSICKISNWMASELSKMGPSLALRHSPRPRANSSRFSVKVRA